MAKSSTEEIKRMKLTQPKMVMVVDGLTGKRRMVVAEISQSRKEQLAKHYDTSNLMEKGELVV